MAEHTPGPWKVQVREDKSGRVRVYAPNVPAPGGQRRTIAYMGSPWSGARPNLDAVNEANARLIAAAPDLLAALKYAAGTIGDAIPIAEAAGYEDTRGAQRTLEMIFAAIAKATAEAAP